ncbi:MAG: ribosomal protein S18-alanine N-acetyltransferase [Candidatus Natronoplasma sp.]
MPLIRKFVENDLEKVHNIASLSLKEKYPPRLYLSIRRTWGEGFLVAQINGEVVGFICGVKERGDTTRVLILAVDPLQRNRGIGSELLKNFIEVSSREGAVKVTLEVRVGNDRTIRFYQKRGFQIIDRLKSFYSNGEDGYKMIRYL